MTIPSPAAGTTRVHAHRLAVAADLEIDVVDVVAARPGPRLALLGGVHGDEPEGPLAVMRVVAAIQPLMVAGSVRAVAVANPPAFRADQRESPVDGGNLARAFPGREDGSPTERLAWALHEQVIARASFVVDLHSAGRDFAMPLFCGFRDTEATLPVDARAAARAFGAPLAWRQTGAVAPGRTVSSATELGIPCIYAEAEGGQEVRGRSLDVLVTGTLRIARLLGITRSAPPAPPTPLLIDGGGGNIDTSLRAACDGYVVTRCAAGDVVERDEPIAELLDDDGRTSVVIASPRRGTVMLLRRRARVRREEIVAFVAGEPTSWPAPR